MAEITARCSNCAGVRTWDPVGWIAMVTMPPTEPAMRAIPDLRLSVIGFGIGLSWDLSRDSSWDVL